MRIPRANCSSFVSMTMPSICGARSWWRGGRPDCVSECRAPYRGGFADSWAGCSVVGRTRSRSTKVPFCWWLRFAVISVARAAPDPRFASSGLGGALIGLVFGP